mmetsp:Transcript_6945/g.16764  ORF Transcript_6945/g.16764 Transcript_6945/m.16764 type:complete len:320 (+) Transcript_6945:23-982(+)
MPASAGCRRPGGRSRRGVSLGGAQIRGQHLALVEHEAVAVVVRAAGVLEVLQDAAIELPGGQALFGQHHGRLLAADATGAIADDGFADQFIAMGRQRGGKVAELVQPPVDGAIEGAMIHLEAVAGVQHHDLAAGIVVALVQPACQCRRCQCRRARRLVGSDGGMVHPDDLGLDLDLEPLEGLGRAPAALGRQRVEARVGPQFGHPGVDGLGRAGEEEVDALLGDQHRALQAQGLGARMQALAQRLGVGQRDEQIAGDVEDGAGLHQAADYPRPQSAHRDAIARTSARQASRASTTRGSKWLPLPARMKASASSWLIACL